MTHVNVLWRPFIFFLQQHGLDGPWLKAWRIINSPEVAQSPTEIQHHGFKLLA